ncbi:MAG: hypothetical protein EB829_04980 [Nitrosopumilus sp. H8]|nr:MAG: hypothetical protein EB830_06335 [Nitrosopumilus sp. H13]RNJ78305.1 MAG: hypothetical protein EB829_04980 [Nitrosopumilus sp. H8]
MDEDAAAAAIERKKTKPFGTVLFGPGRDEIRVSSIRVYYECLLRASGKYAAEYYRRAKYTISVDSNVHGVMIGDGMFPVRTKSRLERVFVGKKGKNKVDLNIEDHVFVERESDITFDHHGKESKFPYKLNSSTMENYPKRLLEGTDSKVKRSSMTHGEIAKRLKHKLKKDLEGEVRDLEEEFTIREITEVYVPVYEARLIGPRKKVGILRIDAARRRMI